MDDPGGSSAPGPARDDPLPIGGRPPAPGLVYVTVGSRGAARHVDRKRASQSASRGGAWVRALPPLVCPGCGWHSPRHPWGCPVLVRLAAQYLCRLGGGRWRNAAGRLALAAVPHTTPARFWRRVEFEPEPGGWVRDPSAWVPSLVPCPGGLAECEFTDATDHGAEELVEKLFAGPWAARPLLEGAELIPPVDLTPETEADNAVPPTLDDG